jgi:hypothetical protein
MEQAHSATEAQDNAVAAEAPPVNQAVLEMAQGQHTRNIFVEVEYCHVADPLHWIAGTDLCTLDVAVHFARARGVVDASSEGPLYLAQAFARRKLQDRSGQGRLSEDEIGAVHLYTQNSEWFKAVNESLRSQDRCTAAPFLPYMKLLLTALHKVPTIKGVVYRGIQKGLDEVGAYGKGADVTWWGFSSTTMNVDMLKGFLGESGARTQFELEVECAYDVSDCSALCGESEAILPPGTVFTVVDVLPQDDGLTVVHLKQKLMDGPINVAPHVFYTSSNWPSGCRSSKQSESSVADTSLDTGAALVRLHSFTEYEGWIDGPNLLVQELNIEGAKLKASSLPGCAGFTFHADSLLGTYTVYFKGELGFHPAPFHQAHGQARERWFSFLAEHAYPEGAQSCLPLQSQKRIEHSLHQSRVQLESSSLAWQHSIHKESLAKIHEVETQTYAASCDVEFWVCKMKQKQNKQEALDQGLMLSSVDGLFQLPLMSCDEMVAWRRSKESRVEQMRKDRLATIERETLLAKAFLLENHRHMTRYLIKHEAKLSKLLVQASC